MIKSTRDVENTLLPLAEYDHLASTWVPRANYFPKYRDRVTRSHQHVHPWSARRLSLTCVAKLNVDTFLST